MEKYTISFSEEELKEMLFEINDQCEGAPEALVCDSNLREISSFIDDWMKNSLKELLWTSFESSADSIYAKLATERSCTHEQLYTV